MAQATAPELVLVVDDEPEELEAAAEALQGAGFFPERAASGDQACERLAARPFDLVVTDIVMRGTNGYDVVRQALKVNSGCICITMTNFGSLEAALDSLRFGAYSFIQKPLNAEEFLHLVRRGLEKQRLAKELLMRNQQLEELNRELDARVRAATRELEELNRRILTEMASLREIEGLKSAFLGNVSHDLRGPLTTIKGYLSCLIEDQGATPVDQAQVFFQAINSATGHLSYLVEQLLEATQLESRTIRLDLQDLSVSKVLDECAALLGAQARAGGLELIVSVDSGSDLGLRADRGRVLQILSNLIGNAVKFTPRGGRVIVAARSHGSDIHFCVEDTGPGIAAEHREKIFDRFFQASLGGTLPGKGLGLGLNIVKGLVSLHGGSVRVESEPGRGSRFHVRLPRDGPPSSPGA